METGSFETSRLGWQLKTGRLRKAVGNRRLKTGFETAFVYSQLEKEVKDRKKKISYSVDK